MQWIVFVLGLGIAFVLGFEVGTSSSGRDVPSTAPSTETQSAEITNALPDIPKYAWYPVVKVVDGDTIVVEIDGKNTTVRLIGLDTPETVDPRKPVQCFGKAASEKAKQILSGSSVRLETDPSQGTLDKYGRTLAYVFLQDETNFNKLMIAEGYGHEYTYNLPYKYQVEFKAAERKAREEKKGLWADGACMSDFTNRSSPDGNKYDCSKNIYNCSSFKTQTEAQTVFDVCGGSANDIHKLDSDSDGVVCESLP